MKVIMKKLAGLIVLVFGFLVSGYGLFIFGGSIYYANYSRLHPGNFGYGDAAGLGFFYGLAIFAIGLIPVALGNLIFGGKKSLIYKLLFGENR